MTQYSTLNVKLSNSQLNKLKSAITNGTEVTLNLIGSFNDETNFPHKSLLTNTQVSKICKAFANGSSANIKFSKMQLSKIVQSGGFLCRLLGPLLKTGLPLKGNLSKLLGLTAAAAATDAAIQKRIYGTGTTTLISLNEKMEDILKTVNWHEESGLLIKGIKNERTKEQKKEFLGMLLGIFAASILRNALTGRGVIRAGKGAIRAGGNL